MDMGNLIFVVLFHNHFLESQLQILVLTLKQPTVQKQNLSFFSISHLILFLLLLFLFLGWSGLSSGLDNVCIALAFYTPTDTLYIGGRFYMAGGLTANGVTAWSGSAFIDIPAFYTQKLTIVYTLLLNSNNGLLFVGGSQFLNEGTVQLFNITQQAYVGSVSINETVSCFGLNSNQLYVAGANFFYSVNTQTWVIDSMSNVPNVRAIVNNPTDSSNAILIGGSANTRLPESGSQVSSSTLAIRDNNVNQWKTISSPIGTVKAIVNVSPGVFIVAGSDFETLPFGICSRGIGILDLTVASAPISSPNVPNGAINSIIVDRSNYIWIGGKEEWKN